jgi:hypothetical protein
VTYEEELARSYGLYPRRTCPGGYDYAGHDCDKSGCPEGENRGAQ